MLKRRIVALSLILSTLVVPVAAQNGDADLLNKIRKEAMQNSQIMKTMHMLTDVYGPRLTGSPNHKRAAEWAVRQMTEWGFVNGHLEPWNFGHPGWLNERLNAHIISPVKDSLVCEVLAWTPSTNGRVRKKVVQIVLPERPTQEQFNEFVAKEKARVKDRIVMVGKHTVVPVNLSPPPKRADDKQIPQRFHPDARPSPTPTPSPTPAGPTPLTNQQLAEQTDQFLKENGAVVRVND